MTRLPGGHVPVFYINVAARTDRREFMEAQFANLGVVGERVEAAVPADVPPDVAASARRPDGTWRMGLGEIACTMSHFAAWQRAIDRGAMACAVFEDDGVISERFPDFLEALGPSLPQDIDLLKFETSRKPVRLGRRALPLLGFTMQRLTSTHYGDCGYVISTRLAAKLLATLPLAPLPLDDYLFARSGDLLYTGRVYQLVPALAVQLVYQHASQTAGVARSDLEDVRQDKWRGETAAVTGWSRTRRNLALAWRELAAFGRDALRQRAPIPFADDVNS